MEDQKIDVLVIKQLLAYSKKLGFLTSQCGHGTMWISEQVISDPTHILESIYRFNLFVATKFSYELRRLFFTSPYLSSSNNTCKI